MTCIFHMLAVAAVYCCVHQPQKHFGADLSIVKVMKYICHVPLKLWKSAFSAQVLRSLCNSITSCREFSCPSSSCTFHINCHVWKPFYYPSFYPYLVKQCRYTNITLSSTAFFFQTSDCPRVPPTCAGNVLISYEPDANPA